MQAQALPLVEKILYNQAWFTRLLLINFDNDAISCYNRIIPSFASMTARFYEQSDAAIFVNNIMLKTAPKDGQQNDATFLSKYKSI